MTGMSAERIDHWLIVDETRFMTAIGAFEIWRAQLNAESFSGNSERNGATHWTKTNGATPTEIASASIDSTNAWAETTRIAPADEEDARDGPAPPPGPVRQRPAGHGGQVLHLLHVPFARAGRAQERRGRRRTQDENGGVDEAERALPPDDGEPEERREEAHHLDRVLVVEPDRDPRLPLLRPAGEEGGHEVDERPAEADEEADRAGEVRDREVDLRRVLPGLPRDDGLDRELGERLEPREDREREPLRDEELRRLGRPGDEERGEQDGGERPERGERRGLRGDRRRRGRPISAFIAPI